MRKQMQEEARTLINTMLEAEEVFTSGFIADLLSEDRSHKRTEWNEVVWSVIERGKRLGCLEADNSKSPIEFTKKKDLPEVKSPKRKAKKAVPKADEEQKLNELQLGKAVLALIEDLKKQIKEGNEERSGMCEDFKNCLREKTKLEQENAELNRKLISLNSRGIATKELEKFGYRGD